MRFATAIIRSGKEKDDGQKIYRITSDLSRGKISVFRTWCSPEDHHFFEVGILVKENERIECEDPSFCVPRINPSYITLSGFTVRSIWAYGPTNSDSSRDKEEDFFFNRERAIDKNKNEYCTLIGSDFDAVGSTATMQ